MTIVMHECTHKFKSPSIYFQSNTIMLSDDVFCKQLNSSDTPPLSTRIAMNNIMVKLKAIGVTHYSFV